MSNETLLDMFHKNLGIDNDVKCDLNGRPYAGLIAHEALRYLNEARFPVNDEGFLIVEDEKQEELSGILCDTLIHLNGTPNYDLIIALERVLPVKIGPGESDSFGWLTGLVTFSNKSKFVFG